MRRLFIRHSGVVSRRRSGVIFGEGVSFFFWALQASFAGEEHCFGAITIDSKRHFRRSKYDVEASFQAF